MSSLPRSTDPGAVDLTRFASAGIAAGRAPALGARAMVTASSGWATLIGLEVLRSGGSSVDAAIAMGAALVVAAPHQCGLGGDAFWLIRPMTGETAALNASGRAPAAADAEELRGRGLTAIPARSGYAVTAPGVVSGWIAAHQRYGRVPFDRLLAPAIAGAERGLAVTPLFASQLARSASLLASRRESARVFLPLGRAPRVGDTLRSPDLARTLRILATDPGALYTGALAEQIAAAVQEDGGWLTADDLARHRCDWATPVQAPFAGWIVEEMPPNSQGVAALLGLLLLDDLGLSRRDDDPEWAHRSVEVAKILMSVRDAEIGDPAAMRTDAAELLADRYLQPLRELLRGGGLLSQAAVRELVGAGAHTSAAAMNRDTVHFAIVDDDGLAVSCIQSVFSDFGSGIVVPGTGIVLHNRGSSFILDPGRVATLTAGRRPMHTLAPGMATTGGRTAAVFGTRGGHAQAQVHVQLLGALAGQRLDPMTALTRARWFVPPVSEGEDEVRVEDRDGLAGALERRGHLVHRVEPFAQEMGHAQAILVDTSTGTLIGAADPRSDGIALGY